MAAVRQVIFTEILLRFHAAQPDAPVHLDQMVVNRFLLKLFVADVAPVSLADRALNVVTSVALDGGRGASGAFGHIRSFDGRRPAVLANKVARRTKRHFGLAGAGDRTDLLDLGTTCGDKRTKMVMRDRIRTDRDTQTQR